MRKLSIKRLVWLDRQVQRTDRALQMAAGRRRNRRGSKRQRSRTCIIGIPAILTAEKLEHRLKILDVIRQIDDRMSVGGWRVKLDFSRVQKIFPGGMLLLLAALQQRTQNHPGKVVARCPPNSMAAQLLNHFDMADALGVPHCQPTAHSVVSWRHLSGTHADGQELKELLDHYRTTTEAQIPDELFAVLSEGLTNVRQHAYTASTTTQNEWKRWWLFARCAEPSGMQNGNLYIAIYDMGVGIPATLRQKLEKKEIAFDWWDQMLQAVRLSEGTKLDQRLLQAAVEDRRSQTGQPHRGNGLPEMREFAVSTEGGRLHIVSGHAQYSLIGGKNDGQITRFEQKFPGTLLLWGLPLTTKENSI
jgi:hypothetical protein